MSNKTKVLVIDDNVGIRQIVKKALSRAHDVRAVGSAEDGLAEIAGGFLPDVAIVDQNLPGMTGEEFIRKTNSKGFCFIVITGMNVSSEFVSNVMQLGALYVLKKPFSLVELQAMVKNALGESHA